MKEEKLLESLLTVNVLTLNTLYEIREILSMKENTSPDHFANAVENTAAYVKTRQNDIIKQLEET